MDLTNQEAPGSQSESRFKPEMLKPRAAVSFPSWPSLPTFLPTCTTVPGGGRSMFGGGVVGVEVIAAFCPAQSQRLLSVPSVSTFLSFCALTASLHPARRHFHSDAPPPSLAPLSCDE